MNLTSADDHGRIVVERAVPLTSVRDILNYIGYKNAPFAEMMNALGYAKSLFYPTDDKNSDQALAYYRQREWRIGPGLTSGGTVHSRSLTEVEKNRLVTIDQRFWERMIGEPAKRRVDSAQVITQFNGSPIAASIRRVIVPPDALDVARDLFGEKAISLAP
jgi:hypothetical protein